MNKHQKFETRFRPLSDNAAISTKILRCHTARWDRRATRFRRWFKLSSCQQAEYPGLPWKDMFRAMCVSMCSFGFLLRPSLQKRDITCDVIKQNSSEMFVRIQILIIKFAPKRGQVWKPRCKFVEEGSKYQHWFCVMFWGVGGLGDLAPYPYSNSHKHQHLDDRRWRPLGVLVDDFLNPSQALPGLHP
jgi:hypothetical protein